MVELLIRSFCLSFSPTGCHIHFISGCFTTISDVVKENPGSAWLDDDSYQLLENCSTRKRERRSGLASMVLLIGISPKRAVIKQHNKQKDYQQVLQR